MTRSHNPTQKPPIPDPVCHWCCRGGGDCDRRRWEAPRLFEREIFRFGHGHHRHQRSAHAHSPSSRANLSQGRAAHGTCFRRIDEMCCEESLCRANPIELLYRIRVPAYAVDAFAVVDVCGARGMAKQCMNINK